MDLHGRSTLGRAAVLLGSLALVACGPSDTEQPDQEQVPDVVVTDVVPVDTTAAALWSHVESEQYSADWSLWPGTQPFYEGGEPHGRLLTTYVNDAAMRGLDLMSEGAEDHAPFGSVVVKENYMPDSTLAAVTVMYKAEGYDPAHNDWFWMKRLTDGTVEASGRVASCIDCHEDAVQDYLMTGTSESDSD